MYKKIIIIFTIALLGSCKGVKSVQKNINTGDYDEAIKTATNRLKSDKNKESNQPYVLLLEEAFKKAAEQDIERIDYLRKEGSTRSLETIYMTYRKLRNRQQKVKPFLPIRVISENREAKFELNDYSSAILDAKNELVLALYNESSLFLKKATTKSEFRNIYSNLKNIQTLSPNYKNTKSLMDEAHYRGTNFIIVSLKNNSEIALPKRLEKDLLNFDTNKLNDFWNEYHTKQMPRINYDYNIVITFANILISPEQVKEESFKREKEIKDGWEYLKSKDGEVVRDEKGNRVKVDVYRPVNCTHVIFSQFKSVKIVGVVYLFEAKSKQQLKKDPLQSEFFFNHSYARAFGDKRALSPEEFKLTEIRAIPFPSNEQMIFDSGEDLKEKIKYRIKAIRF